MGIATIILIEFLGKIKPQFPRSPEGLLFFAVIEQAMKDLTLDRKADGSLIGVPKRLERGTGKRAAKAAAGAAAAVTALAEAAYARLYFSRGVVHAEACGVSSVWVLELFKRAQCEHLLKAPLTNVPL